MIRGDGMTMMDYNMIAMFMVGIFILIILYLVQWYINK